MAYAISNLSPADALRAIIAAGVAAYQESLPAYARDAQPVVLVPDHALADVETEPNLTLDEDRQRELCLSCSLADCVGIESPACPIRREQRAEWRRKGVNQ
jgi:hypothetical protein